MNQQTGVDPVNVANGEFYMRKVDLSFPGRGVSFTHQRTYRSRLDYDGPLGFGWDHTYNQRLVLPWSDCTSTVVFATGEGTSIEFTSGRFSTAGIDYSPPEGIELRLRLDFRREFTMVSPDGTTRKFNERGLLVSMTDANGVGLTIRWEPDPTPRAWRVASVTDSEGRTIEYEYTNGRLREVRERRLGLAAKYTYAGADLESATNAAGEVESYGYSGPLSGRGERIPEMQLEAACKLSCAPAGSRCGAGGGCPDLAKANDVRKWCGDQKARCKSACEAECPNSCRTGCRTECESKPCAERCQAGTFADACEDRADRFCVDECNSIARDYCRQACTFIRNPNANPIEIVTDSICVSSCRDCVLHGRPYVDPAAGGCAANSCNRGHQCFVDCRARVLSGVNIASRCASPPRTPGCAAERAADCQRQCQGNQLAFCSRACAGEGFSNTACVRSACPQSCERGCDKIRTNCNAQAAACPADCTAACVAREHQRSGVVYGRPGDYAHNLTEIYRGPPKTGQLILRNVYGEQVAKPDFDALVRQENSGHDQVVQLTYFHRGIDKGVQYQTGALDSYEPVEICPRGSNVLDPIQAAIRGRGPRPIWQTDLTDPYGKRWTFFIGAKGEILRTINHDEGTVRSFNYDAGSRLVGLEHPLKGRECFSYDDNGNLVHHTRLPRPGVPSSFARVDSFFHYRNYVNGMSRLEKVMDPRAPLTRALVEYRWDDRGNLRSAIDAEGLTTTFTPDVDGRPREERRPDGTLVRYDYERGALRRTTIDANGPSPIVTTLEPDAAGRPERGTGPWGELTAWNWTQGLDRIERIQRTNDDKVETAVLQYNGFGQLREVTKGARRTTYSYDAQGYPRRIAEYALDGSVVPYPTSALREPQILRPEGTTLPSAITCTRFGPDGRVLERVSPDGRRLHYRYDGEGRLEIVEAGSERTTPGAWDQGCPIWRGEPLAPAVVERVDYDDDGRPERLTDARGKVTTIAYDGLGNSWSITDPAGTVTRRGFDQMGNVVWEAVYAPNSAPAGQQPPVEGQPGLLSATELVYDSAGRLHIRREWHLDKDGRRVGDGRAVTRFDHDPRNRRVVTTDDSGAQTTYETDGAGRPAKVLYPTNDFETFEYSGGGRFVRRTSSAPTATGTVRELLRLTSWGAPALLVRNTPRTPRPPFDMDDLRGFLADLREGLRPIAAQSWTYDEGKRLTLTRDVGGLLRAFTYDALDRRRTERSDYGNGQTPELVTFAWTRPLCQRE